MISKRIQWESLYQNFSVLISYPQIVFFLSNKKQKEKAKQNKKTRV